MSEKKGGRPRTSTEMMNKMDPGLADATRRMRDLGDKAAAEGALEDELDRAISALPDGDKVKNMRNRELRRASYISIYGDPRKK